MCPVLLLNSDIVICVVVCKPFNFHPLFLFFLFFRIRVISSISSLVHLYTFCQLCQSVIFHSTYVFILSLIFFIPPSSQFLLSCIAAILLQIWFLLFTLIIFLNVYNSAVSKICLVCSVRSRFCWICYYWLHINIAL